MKLDKWKFLSAMGIFGTIGVAVRFIPLSSAVIALCRGVLGLLFLAAIMLFTKKKPDLGAIRKNLVILIISGAAMGFNWILLFESYRYTTVATATVCYYLAPVLLVLASPLLGERLTAKKLLCVAIALMGLVLVSGVFSAQPSQPDGFQGVLLALGAAVLYTSVMFLNKKLSPIGAYDKTILQLGSSAAVIFPYILLTDAFPTQMPAVWQLGLVLLVGIVHTGIAYTLYFGSIRELDAQTVAIFSYLDPVVAILLSALALGEGMSFAELAGTVLILGSALYSELPAHKKP